MDGNVEIQYVFLDVVGFTRNCLDAETQKEVVEALTDLVRVSLEAVLHEDWGKKAICLPTGDGMCIGLRSGDVDFDTSVQVALHFLAELGRHNASADPRLRFAVRIGVNRNADIVFKDINGRENLAGAGICDSHRVMSAADGGQLLVGEQMYGILCRRRGYRGKFRQFRVTDKHGNRLPVYQFVDDTKKGLNTDLPRAFLAVPGNSDGNSAFVRSIRFAPILSATLRKMPWEDGWTFPNGGGGANHLEVEACLDGPHPESITIREAKGKQYRLDYPVDSGCRQDATDLLFALRAGDCRKTQFCVQVLLCKPGEQPLTRWLIYRVRPKSKAPRLDGSHPDWVIELEGSKDEWRDCHLKIPDDVERTFGHNGWRFDRILVIRLHGPMSLSPVAFYRGVREQPSDEEPVPDVPRPETEPLPAPSPAGQEAPAPCEKEHAIRDCDGISGDRVFVSYARTDKGRVDKLVKRLHDAGFGVWYDEELRGGQTWPTELQHRIDAARVMVVVLSAQSVGSDWVRRETIYAQGRHLPIIPFRLDDAEAPVWLADAQYVGTEEKLIEALGAELTEPMVMSPNPFVPLSGRVDADELFFDRDQEVRRIFELIEAGSSVAVIGERGVGKSSVVHAVFRHAESELEGRRVPVFLDLQQVQDEDDFYSALCEKAGVPTCKGYQLSRVLQNKRLLLILDEVEMMGWEGFTRAVRSQLRGLAEGTDAPLRLIVAGRTPLDRLFEEDLEAGSTSPLAGICTQVEIRPWQDAEAHSFIQARLKDTSVRFSVPDQRELVRQSGGNPHRLMQACNEHYRKLVKEPR